MNCGHFHRRIGAIHRRVINKPVTSPSKLRKKGGEREREKKERRERERERERELHFSIVSPIDSVSVSRVWPSMASAAEDECLPHITATGCLFHACMKKTGFSLCCQLPLVFLWKPYYSVFVDLRDTVSPLTLILTLPPKGTIEVAFCLVGLILVWFLSILWLLIQKSNQSSVRIICLRGKREYTQCRISI